MLHYCQQRHEFVEPTTLLLADYLLCDTAIFYCICTDLRCEENIVSDIRYYVFSLFYILILNSDYTVKNFRELYFCPSQKRLVCYMQWHQNASCWWIAVPEVRWRVRYGDTSFTRAVNFRSDSFSCICKDYKDYF